MSRRIGPQPNPVPFVSLRVNAPNPNASGLPSGRLAFEDFELRLDTSELSRDGRPVKLQRQPARLLGLLASRSGEMVTREEIRREIWGEDAFLEVESAINFAVRQIRRALGDSATEPRFVETLPRLGYRFLPAVRRRGDGEEPAATEAPAPPPVVVERLGRQQWQGWQQWRQWRQHWSRWRGWPWVAGAALLAAFLFALGGSVAGRFGSSPRLLVLPVDPIGGSTVDRDLVEGLIEDLTGELTRRYPGHLAILATNSAMHYRKSGKSPREIAAKLGADYLVLASLGRSGDRSRVHLEILEPASGREIQVENVAVPLADFAQLPSALGEQIGRALQLEPAVRRGRKSPISQAAYEAYLEGIYLGNQAGWPGASDPAALALQRATTLAPDFAPAWGRLALARLSFSRPASQVAPGVEEAARQALRLDPGCADAHTALGRLALFGLYDLGRARTELELALGANPGSADAHLAYAEYLAAVGSLTEAIAEAERARRLDPVGQMVRADLVWYHYLARHYDEAIAEARIANRLDPTTDPLYWLLSLLMKKDDARALGFAREYAAGQAEILHLPPPPPFARLADFWTWRLHWMEARGGISPGALALSALALGDRNRALSLFERACQEHFGWMLPFLSTDPFLDPLRGDPRFTRILRCAGHAERRV
jgi:DNA-binding winged helix-turn-helix (wHTH) protein/TolB-like protein/tetratricopeptide (TPR) repeat protein